MSGSRHCGAILSEGGLNFLIYPTGLAWIGTNTMWRTQTGNRILTEREWSLFRLGLGSLLPLIQEDIENETDETETGVKVFDRLTAEQKFALLADVALALHDPTIPPPHHTAANEGAIMAVFFTLRGDLEYELESSPSPSDEPLTFVREALLAACADSESPEEPLPDLHSTEIDEWEWLLDEVENRIFWDYDFADGDRFLDLPPEEAEAQLKMAGVDPDYHLAVPDEPTESGLISARQIFARLLELPVPDDEGLYPALDDIYHAIIVGPCSPEVQSKWKDHSWIQVVGLIKPEWDCDYSTWSEKFVASIPIEPFALDSTLVSDEMELPPNVTVEKLRDDWVVKEADGLFWCDLLDNGWTDEADDEDTSILRFSTKEEAISGFAQANRMYGERAERYTDAMKELGWDEEEF